VVVEVELEVRRRLVRQEVMDIKQLLLLQEVEEVEEMEERVLLLGLQERLLVVLEE
jgi:hypothetical protein